MNKYERVKKAIYFKNPDRIPVWNINMDQKEGDLLWYDLRVYEDEDIHKNKISHGSHKSEWGYVWENLNDGTMGQPKESVIKTLEDIDNYTLPKLAEKIRFAALESFLAESEGYYRLGMLVINGFTTYTFLRGFENAMVDFALRDERALNLLKNIFEFEKSLIKSCKERGFHGFHLGDDWGMQNSMIISPIMWDEIFSPLYKDIIDFAHGLGMEIWFHSCGNFTAIIERLHSLGVDVINIAQPNVVDYEAVGKKLKGKQCFLMPLSYQTTSISGVREDIFREAEKMFNALGTIAGGFIGYTEEYYCLGMSKENFNACKEAFTRIGLSGFSSR